MRHRISGNRLGRFSSLRKATIRDLAKATLIRQRICTTKQRAKEARKVVERLITLGKRNTLSAKRKAFSILCDHSLVSDLFKKIAVRFNNRVGGYTRIIHLSIRRGDNAFLVYLELTEKEIIIPKTKKESEKTKAKSKMPAGEQPAKTEKQQAPGPEPKKHPPEAKKEPSGHSAPSVAPPVKEAPGKDKSKSKNVMGGFKRLFNKKPSSE